MIEDTNFSLQSNNVFSKQKLLSKVVFEEIVGSDMLNKIEHTEDLNDAEKVLKNVWKYFGSTELEDDSAANIVSSEQDEQPSHPMNISEKSTSPFQLQKNPEETYALKQQGPSSEAHKKVSQESSLKSARRQLFSIGEPSSSSSESPLAKILHWPDSPKRKGKRNVPRYPFVTSSRQWQLFHLAKENKKQEEINLKEERKLQQRKRKAEKEEKKSSKKDMSAAPVSPSLKDLPKVAVDLKSQLEGFNHENMKRASTTEKNVLPTAEDVATEKTQKALLEGVEGFDTGKLKHTETHEKNPLPDKDAVMLEKVHQNLISGVEGFDKARMKHTTTQEKNVLPDPEAIEAEKGQQKLIEGIENFDPKKLKHTETQEKNPLPTKEAIDQEKSA